LQLAFTKEIRRPQRRSDGTISLEGTPDDEYGPV
jgi:hypothetical protein